MKNLYLILTLAITSLWLYSCDPNKQDPCQDSYKTVNLTDFQKTRCPYSGNDTLIFISNQNDTAYCYGKGKRTYYITKEEASSPDCHNYSKNETVEYSYVSNNKNFIENLTLTVEDGASAGEVFKIKMDNKAWASFSYLIVDKSYTYPVIVFNRSYSCKLFSNSNPEDSLFYNHTDGIVRVRFSNQLRWDILK